MKTKIILFWIVLSYICSNVKNSSGAAVVHTTTAAVDHNDHATTEHMDTEHAVDYYANIDLRLENVLNHYYPGLTHEQVATYAANISVNLFYFFF